LDRPLIYFGECVDLALEAFDESIFLIEGVLGALNGILERRKKIKVGLNS
jgi:hypothetical protein